MDFAALAGQLSSAVMSDVLDSLGRTGQAMRPFVRPADESLVMVGRARTGLYAPTYALVEGENPYELEMALVDSLGAGEVAVLGCDGPTERIAPWGELLSTAARARGAAGCVTDGLVRDLRQIRAMRFPVFHGGIGPLDTKGRAKMVEMDTAIRCAGVEVRRGDLLVGDVDGLVVIPREVEEQALEIAADKLAREDRTREELAQGKPLSEVFARHGVL